MKSWIFFAILVIIFILTYLAMTKYSTSGEKEGFLVGKTGIALVCAPNSPDVSNCYDISYVDSTTGVNIQVEAQIYPGYYIDVSGYLANIPYGYTASVDKRSYTPNTNIARYSFSS